MLTVCTRVCAALACAAGMLSAVGCGGGGSPQSAWQEFQDAVRAKDGERAWEALSQEGQDGFGFMKSLLTNVPPDTLQQDFGMNHEQLKDADIKKIFVAMIKYAKKKPGHTSAADYADAVVEDVKIDGNKATATMKVAGKSIPIAFVKENGRWKLTMKRGERPPEPKPERQ